MKKNLISLNLGIILLSILSAQAGCKDSPLVMPPDDPKPVITLSVEDVSCTEAWINLKTENISIPFEAILKSDSFIIPLTISSNDTLLYTDLLLPDKTYNFKFNIQQQASSIQYPEASIQLTTFDTTSHSFTWQTWTFGDFGNSVLYDVAIIDEINIWAVGEIYMNDSSGNPDPHAYNAVHWDGVRWELHKFQFQTFCGQPHTGSYPARSIFAFNNNDIYISSTSQITTISSVNQIKTECVPVSINKMWGSSSSDLYAVGNNGSIAHYNGSQWRKIESGTDVDLIDVWGTPDGKSVWACGENLYKTVLLKIQNSKAQIVFEGNYPMQTIRDRFSDALLSLWTNSNNFIYVLSPYNLYRCKNNTTGEGHELYPYDDYFKGAYISLRGTDINNLFTSGNKSTISHFNGTSWKIYEELRNEYQYLAGLDVKENLIVTVGEKFEGIIDYKAVIIVGRKQ